MGTEENVINKLQVSQLICVYFINYNKKKNVIIKQCVTFIVIKVEKYCITRNMFQTLSWYREIRAVDTSCDATDTEQQQCRNIHWCSEV